MSFPFLTFLTSSSPQAVSSALKQIDNSMETVWTFVAEKLVRLEELSEQTTFEQHQLAALVTAKLYFYMSQYLDSLAFALRAGDRFNILENSIFVHTITTKAIEIYIDKQHNRLSQADNDKIAPHFTKLQLLFDNLFHNCVTSSNFHLALSIAIDAQRLDLVKIVLLQCKTGMKYDLIKTAIHIALGDSPLTLSCKTSPFPSSSPIPPISPDPFTEKAQSDSKQPNSFTAHLHAKGVMIHLEKEFANVLLEELEKILIHLHTTDTAQPLDVVAIAKIDIRLNKIKELAELLTKLVSSDSPFQFAQALQIAFDLVESETQSFIFSFRCECIKAFNSTQQKAEHVVGSVIITDEQEEKKAEQDNSAYATGTKLFKPTKQIELFIHILSGDFTAKFYKMFLHHNDLPDMLRLTKIKDHILDESINRSGVMLCNGFSFFGTSHIDFLRSITNILRSITEWPRLEAISALGLVYNYASREPLDIYLPKENIAAAAGDAREGGGLLALGMINANKGLFHPDICSYFKTIINKTTNNYIQYGSAVGIGLTLMGTRDEIYTKFLDKLPTENDATVGEGFAVAIGLLLVGSGDIEVCERLLNIANENKHSKIVIGISYALGLIMFGKHSLSDKLSQLCYQSPNPFVRSASPIILSLAYVGTGDLNALKRLLQIAVTDVNDVVRFNAALGVGFVFVNQQEQCLKSISLLTNSYNPAVRSGSCFALAIAFSGSSSAPVASLLHSLWSTDNVPSVRQSALIAYSLVVSQANTSLLPQLETELAEIDKLCHDERLDPIVKFGAFVCCGLLGAGGQNIVFSTKTRTGSLSVQGIVGFFLFSQFGNWFTYFNLLGLAAMPTCFIGVVPTEDQLGIVPLAIPNVDIPLNEKRPPLQAQTKSTTGTEILSSLSYNRSRSVKQKQRAALTSSAGLRLNASGALLMSGSVAMEEQKKREEEELEEQKRKEELAEKQFLNNPFRLCYSTQQEQTLAFVGCRFVPVDKNRKSGIVILHDLVENAPISYITMNHQPMKVAEEPKKETEMEVEKEAEKEVEKEENNNSKDDESKPLLSQ